MAEAQELFEDCPCGVAVRRFRLSIADAASPAANSPVIGSIAPPPFPPPPLEDGLVEGTDEVSDSRGHPW